MRKRKKANDGLYRRRNDVLAFRYRLRLPDGRMVWREKYCGTKNRAEARAFRQQFMEQVAHGTIATDFAKLKLSEAIDHYFENKIGVLGPRTLQVHRFRANCLKRLFGNKRLSEISLNDLERYQSQRRREGRSPATVNKEIEILRALLKRAKLWRTMVDDYRPLSVPSTSPRRALSVNELVALVKTALTRPAWEAACLASIVAANTTCRSWELKSLRLQDVDMTGNPKLVIRRTNTKSDAGAREIELNLLADWAIRRLLHRAAKLGATEPEHFLFPADLSRHTKNDDPLMGGRGFDPTLHQQSWRTAWRSLTNKAGLPWVDFHCLRHTAITIARLQGVDVAIVKGLAGHMNAKMTDYYTHIGTSVKREAVEKLAEAYRPLQELLGVDNQHSPSRLQ
jgi:integrase